MQQAYGKKIAVVLVNLGTPDAPTATAVRHFLNEFLSDGRVVELYRPLWLFILKCFILPFRPQAVAKKYAEIWQDDSPMRVILNQQAEQLETLLASFLAFHRESNPSAQGLQVLVRSAMTYGKPSLQHVVTALLAEQIEHIVFLPLFPQYSATSTGAAIDAINRVMMQLRNVPSYSILKDYFAHPAYIDALVQSVQRHWAEHGRAEKLLLSFHGIPHAYTEKGDPYARRCHCTAAQVAQQLGLKEGEWAFSFQSRFGKQEWIKPYTDVLLTEWAQQGVHSVQVISPAFSADCLETLEELAITNKELFLTTYAQHHTEHAPAMYDYIAALNTDDAHMSMMAQLAWPLVQGFMGTLPFMVET